MSGLSLLAALKAFDATARAGSMTAAARVLAIQQPTVSSHIQRLEVDFGVELFHRRGRRLELTSFGRTLLDYTRRTFSGEEDAHALLAAAKNQYVGRFVIREEGSTTRGVFEQELKERGVEVQVALEMGSRESVREAVAEGLGLGVVAETAYRPDPRLVKLTISD